MTLSFIKGCHDAINSAQKYTEKGKPANWALTGKMAIKICACVLL